MNASGLLLHTHLGRASLSQPAVDAIVRAATQPLNLEYDLAQGDRGPREETIADLLMDLTAAEAARVVNNNTAAVLPVLDTLATGQEVLVPRRAPTGMGGPFRMLDLMSRSGAIVKEIGTANGARAADYEAGIGERTALIVRLHAGDDVADIVALAKRRGVLVMEALGAGTLIDLRPRGLPKAPVAAERIVTGVDVVTFSGDKIVGGPQAGLVVGRSHAVDQPEQELASPCGRMRQAHDRGARNNPPHVP